MVVGFPFAIVFLLGTFGSASLLKIQVLFFLLLMFPSTVFIFLFLFELLFGLLLVLGS